MRTRAFKNWFGDWENAPEAASRIVDENGEPLVVHHGTPLRRDQITPERGWQRDGITYIPQKAPFHTFKGGEYSGLIFTSVDAEKARGIAETRAMSIPDDKYGNEQWTEEGYMYDLYVNSRNPFDPKDGQAVKKSCSHWAARYLSCLFMEEKEVRYPRRKRWSWHQAKETAGC